MNTCPTKFQKNSERDPPPEYFFVIILCLIIFIFPFEEMISWIKKNPHDHRLWLRTFVRCTPRFRCIPAQRIHKNTPKFQDAQRGCFASQSAQYLFSSSLNRSTTIAKIFCHYTKDHSSIRRMDVRTVDYHDQKVSWALTKFTFFQSIKSIFIIWQ